MGYLTKITKEYFGEDERREEAKDFNIKDMKPVDMGGSVFWADIDLKCKEGQTTYEEYFSPDELDGFVFRGGWRLPTMEECSELYGKGITRWSRTPDRMRPFSGEVVFKVTDENSPAYGNYITFSELGYYHFDEPDKLRRNGGFAASPSYTRPTSDVAKEWDGNGDTDKAYKLTYVFDVGVGKFPDRPAWNFTHNKAVFIPVRLVKDK